MRRRESLAWRSLAVIAGSYAGVLVLACAAESTRSWPVRFSVLPLIAALQNHLQILLHEGAHFHLHPRRRWNDLIADLFCTLPFLGLVSHYRHFHLAHHRHLTDPARDPEVSFYAEQGYRFERQSTGGLARMLAKDLCGYHYGQFFYSYNRFLLRETRAGRLRPLSPREWGAIAAVGVIAGGLLSLPQGAFLLSFYWLLPQTTFMFFFLKLQGYGEHAARTARVDGCTHTQELGKMARFFIYPLSSELHLEHHLEPWRSWDELRPLRGHPSRLAGYFYGERSVLRTHLLSL